MSATVTVPVEEDGTPMSGVTMETGSRLKIELQEPVEDGDEIVTEIVLRRPGGKEFRKIPASGFDAATMDLFLDMASDMSGVLPHVIDRMHTRDLARIVRVVNHLFS